jgi:uncharacterized protein involved in response to NO
VPPSDLASVECSSRSRASGDGIVYGKTLYDGIMDHVFLQKGFRPFFLFGSLLGASLVPWWIRTYEQSLTGEPGLEGISWHSHEMIFGFTVAILAGFLLTAVENWTDRKTARGGLLAALLVIWAIGRLVGFGGVIASIASFAELSFLPLLSIVIAIPLILSQSKRNYLLLASLPALWLCDVIHHLKASGLLPESAPRGDLIAIDIIVLILVIVTGRIVPMFTRNALKDQRIQSHTTLDMASIIAVGVVIVVEVFAPSGPLMLVAAGTSGILVLIRALRWGAFRTYNRPILWILHVGHAWIGVGLLIKAASAVVLSIPASVPTHALTAGAIGTLTLGMMSRVTLGHTGRTLQVSSPIVLAYVSIVISAGFRVFGPWFWPQFNRTTLIISAGCWALAFALYVIANARYLMTPRPDGKPG